MSPQPSTLRLRRQSLPGPPAPSQPTRPPSPSPQRKQARPSNARLDGEGFSPCLTPKAYTNLSDGPHTFEVRATDSVGNTDPTPATRTFTVDTTPPAGKPKLASPKIKPRSKKVRRGRKVIFKVKVRNTGNAAAKKLKVCVRGPKKLVKVPKCRRLGTLAAGKSKTVKFKVKVKKRARKGKKAKLTFTVYAKGAKKKSGKATLKIR